VGIRERIRATIGRSVAEAVQPGFDRLAADQQQLRQELGATRKHLAELMRTIERGRRHDIRFAASARALAETERFVTDHLPLVRSFDTPAATLAHALGLVTGPGLAVEFGVASGRTLRQIAAALPGRAVYGFDVFTGLPEDWRTGFTQGMFAQQKLPDVPGATLVPGLFADTVPAFAAEHPGPIAFLHLDADLYSSTTTVLDLLGDRLVPGTVVVLDEYFNYPGWQDGEFRAWAEFAERTGVQFRYEGYTRDNQQVALTITSVASG
jgi:predicted O-methyltransferase YrrM